MPHRVVVHYHLGEKDGTVHITSPDDWTSNRAHSWLTVKECALVTKELGTPYWRYDNNDFVRMAPESAAYEAARDQLLREQAANNPEVVRAIAMDTIRRRDEESRLELASRRDNILSEIGDAIHMAKAEADKKGPNGRNYALAVTKLEEAQHWVQAILF